MMSPVNYQLKLPTQWSIHDVFHIDLLTPYHKMTTHRPNYSRLPPDLVNDGEEYEVKKILDSQQFGRRHKLQYLIKWKGYPDLDNEWVNKNDVHANDAIREFKNQNPASEMHINTGSMGKYLIPPYPLLSPTNNSHQHMSDINVYYLGTPNRFSTARPNSGLIIKTMHQEVCPPHHY